MSQQTSILTVILLLSLLIGIPLTTAQEDISNPTDKCITEQTQEIGEFEQSNVQIVITPTQGQISQEDINVTLYNKERQLTIPLDIQQEDSSTTFNFTPQDPYIPNGNYTLVASLDYGVWQPTECREFTVQSETPEPWIVAPLRDGLEKSKIGIARSPEDVFILEANEPIECVYRSNMPSREFIESAFNEADNNLGVFGGDTQAQLSWRDIEDLKGLENASSGTEADVYHVCRQTEIGTQPTYTLDIHTYHLKTTSPEIQSVTGIPSVIRQTNGITPEIQVEADTPIYCKAYAGTNPPEFTNTELNQANFSKTTIFDSLTTVTPSRNDNVEERFVCTDLLGETVTGNITIPVDLSDQIQWNTDIPGAVGPNNNPLPISVQAANLDACTVSNGQGTQQDLTVVNDVDAQGFTVFNGSVSLPSQGPNNITVTCSGEETTQTLSEEIIYDSTGPSIEFETTRFACNYPQVDYTLSEALDEHTSVEYVNITYTYKGRNTALKNITQYNEDSLETDFEIGDTYTENITNPSLEETGYTSGEIPFPQRVRLDMTITPVDEVGNQGQSQTKNIYLMNSQDSQCDNIPPTIGLEETFYPNNNSEIIYGDIQCEDDKGCNPTYGYHFFNSRSEADATQCTPDRIRNLDNDVVIDATAEYVMLCAVVWDTAGLQVTDSEENAASPNTDSLTKIYEAEAPAFCRTGNYSELSGETDVDCGGPCPGCSIGKTCKTQHDCAPGLLCGEDSTCEEPPAFCSNDEFNPNAGETDVDCGGPCLACDSGNNCQDNSDCASGLCKDDLTCAAPTCGDGILNQDEIYAGRGGEPDCGGPNCDECEVTVGESCQTDRDCPGKEFV